MRSLPDPFPRIILHLDMDAFFASVEQMDHPEWRGKPVIIGGGTRGVVSTASYEARRFGVHSAMPVTTARRLCPQAVFVRGNRRRYAELSGRIMAALQDFSPLVEPASIDEAYLDATGLERLFGPVERLVPAIKARVREVTGGLTCSVGAAPVKFLAKICSDINKPDGICILRPEDVDGFLGGLDVRRLPGVGRRMVAELEALGIRRVEQLRRYSPELLEQRFGKWGRELHARARGIDPRPVVPEHEAKSESAETTFARDTRDREFLKTMLLGHAERVGASLRRHGLRGRTVTLKIKFADFRQITRSRTLPDATDSTETIYETGTALLEAQALP
ncbi:DNA polymerase IV, partial [Desulfovibrio piger]